MERECEIERFLNVSGGVDLRVVRRERGCSERGKYERGERSEMRQRGERGLWEDGGGGAREVSLKGEFCALNGRGQVGGETSA